MATTTADNASTGNQTTTNVYGLTIAGGSKLASNDILHQIQFADASTATFEYNRQGERITATDQNGTIHAFSYDRSGRPTRDEITFFAAGIDNTIGHIVTSYDAQGRAFLVTDYKSADGSVHSQIYNVYNGLDMVVRQYQEHLGVVRIESGTSSSSSSSSGTAPSLFVDFNFDAAADGNSVYTKGLRPTSIVYPSGRYVRYDYGSAGGDNDKLSRIAAIKDNDGTTTLAAYSYLGANRVVIEDYVQPQVKLDYTIWSCLNPSSSSSGTKYPGFDRFDRVVQHEWCRYGGTPATIDRFDYSYDRNGNPLAKKNYACTDKSELRTYDAVNRLTTYESGALSLGMTQINNPIRREVYSRDGTGNWKCYTVSGTGATALDQQRTHDTVNEILVINEGTGQPAWTDPIYDANGAMTRCPQPAAPTTSFVLTYDAWNRLVKVVTFTGGAIIAEYEYDCLNRRTIKIIGSAASYEHYFYASTLVPIETRRGASSASALFTLDQQYIQGFYGRNIVYESSTVANNSSSSSSSASPSAPTRYYLSRDGIGRATDLFTSSGITVERYSYDAYGFVTFLSATCQTLVPNVSRYDSRILLTESYYDAETLLFESAGAYYHSDLGRYVNRGDVFILFQLANPPVEMPMPVRPRVIPPSQQPPSQQPLSPNLRPLTPMSQPQPIRVPAPVAAALAAPAIVLLTPKRLGDSEIPWVDCRDIRPTWRQCPGRGYGKHESSEAKAEAAPFARLECGKDYHIHFCEHVKNFRPRRCLRSPGRQYHCYLARLLEPLGPGGWAHAYHRARKQLVDRRYAISIACCDCCTYRGGFGSYCSNGFPHWSSKSGKNAPPECEGG